jgi:hypothetical protein
MKFEVALIALREGYHMRRKNWRSTIGWPPGAPNIMMFWEWGFVEPWRPTLKDIQSEDWERAT